MNVRTVACVMLAVHKFQRSRPYFCIQHVYREVTERRLEEVILGTVFQECTVHRVGSNLK